MIAHLGMYDRPETALANDRFWGLIRHHLGYGPAHLDRDQDEWEIWQSPDLLFAQTCGMPFRTRLHPNVTLIGTPDYGLDHCPPGYYHSVIIANKSNKNKNIRDFDGLKFAYNEPLSQSGWAAPVTHMAGLSIKPGSLVRSGSHILSAKAVSQGTAAFAALDALTWKLIQKYDDFAQDLVEITRTVATPTLPYITAPHRDPAPLFTAVARAIDDLTQVDRDILCLRGLISIPAETYLKIPTPDGPRIHQ